MITSGELCLYLLYILYIFIYLLIFYIFLRVMQGVALTSQPNNSLLLRYKNIVPRMATPS